MKVLVLIAICFVVYSKALECGFSKTEGHEIKQAVLMCVKNNETLEQIFEMSMSSSESSISMEHTSERSGSPVTTSKSATAHKTKRALSPKSTESDDIRNGTSQEDHITTEHTSQSEEVSDSCIIQCIIEHLRMTNDAGFPDHTKFSEGLLKEASGRELRNFLQETSDECFQELGEQSDSEPCEYSTKLVTCLAERGKSNCADWPAGSLPF